MVGLALPGTGRGPAAPTSGGPSQRVAANATGLGLTASDVLFVTDGILSELDRATGATTVVKSASVDSYDTSVDGRVDAVIAAEDSSCTTGADCDASILRVGADGSVAHPGLAPVDPRQPLVGGGGRVLASRRNGNGVVAVNLATGARSYAGALGLGDLDTTPLAVDATRAVYIAPTCSDKPVVRFETTRPTVPKKLTHVPCPVQMRSTIATYRAGTMRSSGLSYGCPKGCSTLWDVFDGTGSNIGELFFDAFPGVIRHADLLLHDSDVPQPGKTITAFARPVRFDFPNARHQAPVRLRIKILP